MDRPKPEPVRSLRMEGFPDLLPFGYRDPWPVIDDFDDGGVVLRKNANLQACLGAVLQGIVDQVRQRFTQADGISLA